MADKIAAENAERQKKEEEMAKRLADAQQVSKNFLVLGEHRQKYLYSVHNL